MNNNILYPLNSSFVVYSKQNISLPSLTINFEDSYSLTTCGLYFVKIFLMIHLNTNLIMVSCIKFLEIKGKFYYFGQI